MRLLALTLLLAGTASAQDIVLTPGHPDLNVATLTLSDVNQDVRMIEPQPTALGLNAETLRLDGDVLTLVSRSDIQLEGGIRIDSTRLAWPSLALLSQTIVRGTNSGQATIGDGQLEGAFGEDDAQAPFAFPRTEPVFAAAALPLLVRALPLDQTGYEAEVTVFSPDSRFKDIYLTVGDTETVTLSSGREVDAVVVSQAGGPSGTQRHYVDPDTREIVRTEVRAQGMVIHVTPVTDAELVALQAVDAVDQAAAAAERAAAAQNQIMPGDASLVEISPQMVTYAVKVVEPVQQDLGTVTVTETIADGRLTIANDINIPQAGQVQQDTTVFEYPSLVPISRVEVKPNETVRATFTNGQMTAVTTSGDETTTVEADLEDAFGPNITRFLVRALPFAEDYLASFRQINSDGEISTSQLRVTGQETHTMSDGTERTVWVVLETEEGNPDYTYYIDTETRELLKNAFAPQPGVRIEIVVP